MKETKRQGRIAHHHSDATVPHIVALLGFSFHLAKIRISEQSSKQFNDYFIFFLKNHLTFILFLYLCRCITKDENMDYDDGFILQKDVNWSLLNEGLAIPISVCSRLAHTGTVSLFLDMYKESYEIENINLNINYGY